MERKDIDRRLSDRKLDKKMSGKSKRKEEKLDRRVSDT